MKKTLQLFIVLSVILTSCGLNVSSDSSAKKFLTGHAFSYWLHDNESEGAASTYTFNNDGSFTANFSGTKYNGRWSLGTVTEKSVENFKSRELNLEFNSSGAGFAGNKAVGKIMEENQVINIENLIYHIDSRQ